MASLVTTLLAMSATELVGFVGAAPSTGPAWLGVVVVDSSAGGARIVEIIHGSPAEDTGLIAGDIVVGVGGHSTMTASDLIAVVQRVRIGASATIEVRRNNETIIFDTILSAKLSENDILVRRFLDRELPRFNMPSLSRVDGVSGVSGNSADHLGDVVVLYFVGSQCSNCSHLSNELEALSVGHKSTGLVVIEVTEPLGRQLRVTPSSSIGLPTIADLGGRYRSQVLRASKSPLVVVADRSHHVRYIGMGTNVDFKKARRAALRALNEPY